MSEFARGVDVSTLLEVESLGGKFYRNGIKGDLFDILGAVGVNYIRLRLWNNPFDDEGHTYGAGTCDFETVLKLAQRAKFHGMKFLLDFHYSDFWCDPQRQILPKAWEHLDFYEIKKALYVFTYDTIMKFKAHGIDVDMVQVGNEITGGMCWPYGKITYDEALGKNVGFDALCDLLKEGVQAVKDTCGAKIMIHLERSYDIDCYQEYFKELESHGVEYDAIGLSYYPFWHHNFSDLKKNLEALAVFKKELYIAETAYPWTGKPYEADGVAQSLIITDGMKQYDGTNPPYPLTQEGQKEFVRTAIDLIKNVDYGCGFFYWEPGWLPVKGSTWATKYARIYIHEEYKKDGNEWANQCLFDYDGNATIALEELGK